MVATNRGSEHQQAKWDRIAEDEPVFIIRGQDQLAVDAVQSWIDFAVDAEVSDEKITEAEEHLEAFRDWQAKHYDRVKLPD